MDKRRLLHFLLVIAFILGVVLLIVGGVLYWHYHNTGNDHSTSELDQVSGHYTLSAVFACIGLLLSVVVVDY